MRKLSQYVVAGWLLAPASAVACPWCGSAISEQVRAEILGGDFAANLAVAALPFPVLLAIVAIVYFWPANATSRERPETKP